MQTSRAHKEWVPTRLFAWYLDVDLNNEPFENQTHVQILINNWSVIQIPIVLSTCSCLSAISDFSVFEISKAAIYVNSRIKYNRKKDLEGVNSHLVILDLKSPVNRRNINIYRCFSPQFNVAQRDKFAQQLQLLWQILQTNIIYSWWQHTTIPHCQAHSLADTFIIPLMYNFVLWKIFLKKKKKNPALKVCALRLSLNKICFTTHRKGYGWATALPCWQATSCRPGRIWTPEQNRSNWTEAERGHQNQSLVINLGKCYLSTGMHFKNNLYNTFLSSQHILHFSFYIALIAFYDKWRSFFWISNGNYLLLPWVEWPDLLGVWSGRRLEFLKQSFVKIALM